MSDLISRQAAIDIERNATVDTNPSHFEANQKFIQFMDDEEISSFGRWQWSNGFNTALTAVGIDLKKLPTIDAESLITKHEGIGYEKGYRDGYAEALEATDDTETVRHGHWEMLHKTHGADEDSDYDWRCSECSHVDCHNIHVEVPYCWYCGTKMDETEYEEPEINPCRGCEDYNGKGGCLSNGGCGERREDETD